MTSLQVNALNFNKKISINFEGGNLSSDSGLLAYRCFDEKIGLSKLLKNNFIKFESACSSSKYSASDVIIQNIYKSIAGYHTDISSNELAHDPVFKQILNVDKLASQPTISRRLNELDKKSFKLMQLANTSLLSHAYAIEKPKFVIFDIDSTGVQTYGKQHGSDYNSHYSSTGFHPLVLFDGMTGDLIKAELRSGNVYTSRNTVSFMGPVLKHYNTNYKDTYTIIRGDSGFAMPKFYELSEEHGVPYAIRLKANAKLKKSIDMELKDFYDIYGADYSKTNSLYGEFMYKASSWDIERRICFKIERKAGTLLPTCTFIVTTMDAFPKDVVKFYSNRGKMENFIKEAKLNFGMDTLSHTSFMANANRMMQILLAYNLNNLMRRLCFDNAYKASRMNTLRIKLTKIAGRFVCSGRYITFKLCSSYPYKDFFVMLFQKINLLTSCG